MSRIPALTRFIVLGITAGLLLSTPGQPLGGFPSAPTVAEVPSAAAGRAGAAAGAKAVPPAPGEPVAAPYSAQLGAAQGGLRAAGGQSLDVMAPGSVVFNPVFGRDEVVVADPGRTALLIGDSQSSPANGWPRQALAALGYNVHFCGLGGTGFVASRGAVGNYIDALEQGDWLLPAQAPALIIVEGGGNDAAQGASDGEIRTNADRLLTALKSRFPTARIVMVGTLARDGGGRRTEVDALVGSIAAAHGLEFVGVGDWLTRYDLERRLMDSVHMDNEGRRVLGNLLARRFKDMGVPDLKSPAGDAVRDRGTGRELG
ncbi:SGNH/GDSL hydrolase family protein [Pseudarthrobacter sp. NPDC092419]|uniref:SGNH/GDSL hydrolase family protein n=1 Tax=Pseudarthrobacter sp. NPDC092419 TaxID=3364414 RepID=UPI0037FE1F7A